MTHSPFDFVKSIMNGKEQVLVTEENRGEYIPWVVNRALSAHPDCIFYVQDMNLFRKLPENMQNDYLYHSIRKKYRPFVPYPKNKETESISLISQAYKYNYKKAREVAALLSEEQINSIRELLYKGE
jgi:hypothetical protein